MEFSMSGTSGLICREPARREGRMQKKLMLLGGIRYLLPVIEAAHKIERGIK